MSCLSVDEPQVRADRYLPAVSGYDWDPEKSLANLAKHGISFEEAAAAADHRDARWFADAAHSLGEDRFWVLGPSPRGDLLLVVTSEGGPKPRIVSAWRATKRERREYREP